MISRNKIKFIQSLSLKKNRELHQCFIVQGEKSVLELLSSDFEILELYATNEWEVAPQDIVINRLPNRCFQRISTLKSPNKVLAIVKIPKFVIPKKEGVVLVLDNLKNPGNLGTIIRVCDWFGIEQIVCSLSTVDVYNPKVVQATMGSLFRVNIIYTDLNRYLSDISTPVYAASMKGENIRKIEFPTSFHLILGNESKGISATLDQFITKNVTIKNTDSKAESLNVAVAAAIFLYESS